MTVADPTGGKPGAAHKGMRIGDRYQLLEPIAAGGMAQVWEGFDEGLNRRVAVKLLHPHLYGDQKFLERFRREAVAAARLTHRSIVAIFDTHSSPGLEAIVMELIEGRTLRDVLNESPKLSPRAVMQLGISVAGALDVAHRAGIVHRDIKPANIMVSKTGDVKVTDFGIAKGGADVDLTDTGTLLGTAKYLAPEQVEGRKADPRSDIYSLGVVLYEALAGGPPFAAETEAATALARLQHDPPRISLVRPETPRDLADIVMRCIARNPDHRYSRAYQLGEELASVDLTKFDEAPQVNQHGLPQNQTGNPATNANPGVNPQVGAHPGDHSGALARAQHHPQRATDSGFDLNPPPDTHPVRKKGKGRWRFFAGIATVAVIGGALWSGAQTGVVNSGSGGSPIIIGATSFDPQSKDRIKSEREDLVWAAYDGDDSTEWQTEPYRAAKLSGLKDGVGLLLQLEASSSISEITVVSRTAGWSAEIYVGDQFDETDLAAWGPPVATVEGNDGSATIHTEGAEGSLVLLWITDTGLTDQRFRFDLGEITAK